MTYKAICCEYCWPSEIPVKISAQFMPIQWKECSHESDNQRPARLNIVQTSYLLQLETLTPSAADVGRK
jgi:hypothetical protein